MIPFAPPRIDQKTIDEVTRALQSGWITTGPRTQLFEERISAYCGHQETLCVSSNSGGMELMLRWFGVGPGDEVIVPAYTYCATANVVMHCGATPVMVDVDENCLIDLRQIEKNITARTKVVMPVDLAGLPCDYSALHELLNSAGVRKLFSPTSGRQKLLGRILVLADAAHSIGGLCKGQRTGALTDLTVFSFHAVKNLTTAEGGAICLNLPAPFDNKIEYGRLRTLSLHGQTKDAFSKTQAGNWKYDVVEAGYKLNMTDVQAAIGLVELERYEQETLPRRVRIFELYAEAFKQYDWAQTPLFCASDRHSSCHFYMLRVIGADEAARAAIIDQIAERQVAVNVHYIPLPMLSFYRQAGYAITDFPVSFENYQNEITLPVYYDLSDAQVQQVVEAVVSSVKSVMRG